MKIHLPYLLRVLLLAGFVMPAQAELTWKSGDWNEIDSSWNLNGQPAVFSNGDAVLFASDAADTMVNITSSVVPSSMVVSGSGFVFAGNGSIMGEGSLSLLSGATLSVQNANAFTGGTVVSAGAALTLGLYDAVGSASAGELSLGQLSGSGLVIISLQSPSSLASIQGNTMADFTGVLRVEQGNVGLGRRTDHSGAGSNALLGAARVEVATEGSFIVTLGGGQASLETGNSLQCDVWTVDGAVVGNRDGHVNWLGDVYLNVQDFGAETPLYNASGVTEMSLYYAKYVVWDGVVAGDGVLRVTSGAPDTGLDHRLVLAHGANTFRGTYQVTGNYLTTLALAAENAAVDAGVELTSENSRLVLMSTSAVINSLNGTAGVVQAEGAGDLLLTVSGGNYGGLVRDADSLSAGLSLGLVKTGDGTLQLNGVNCTYTGATQVLGGVMQFAGDVALGNILIADSAARLEVSGSLHLREQSIISVDMMGTTGAGIDVAGAFTAAQCGVELSGYEELVPGSYEILMWGTSPGVSSSDFVAMGLSDTADKVYSVQVQGNALVLVVGDMDSVPWLWAGGSAVWADDSAEPWANAGSGSPAGQQVTFSARDAGTVTIDRVTPAGIAVIGGNYTFIASSATSSGMVSPGTLLVSGADTVLSLALDNPDFTGRISLAGGVLELASAGALGDATIAFNGGQLRYGSGMTTDVSAQIAADSLAAVRVDTNGNDITWSTAQPLSPGIEKSGEGRLQLSWTATGETQSGVLDVQAGTLSISKSSGNGTLAGTFSGSGTLELTSASGLLTVSGDNSGFAGTLVLAGDGSADTGSICFSSGESMGGADTLVQVAGQRFWFNTGTSTGASLDIVQGTSTYMDGSTGRSYAFSGTISGSGTLILKPSSSITMSGDVSQFTGQFVHPGTTAVTWLFGGEGIAGNGLVQANLNSSGSAASFAFQYSSATMMSGVISGSTGIRQLGSGTLTLTGQNRTTGLMYIADGCTVQLGSGTTAASWAGSVQSGTGSLTLVNGALLVPLSTVEGTLTADVATAAVVNMGGMSGGTLQSIALGADGQLAGMSGNLVIGGPDGVPSLYLALGSSNIGASAVPSGGKAYMLGIEGGTLQIADAASVTLDLESIKDILSGQRQAVYLHLSNVDIELLNGVTAADLFANSPTSPEALGLVVLGTEGGNVVLEGAVREVYMVMENGDYPTVTTYDRLADYMATFVDTGYTLSLNLPGDNTRVAWVNNLVGSGNLSVTNTSENTGIVRVLLNNEVLGTTVGTANTEFEGDIAAGSAVQLVKTGPGVLTVGGALTADWLEVDEGTLHLTGDGSSVETLHGDGGIVLDGTLEILGDARAYTGTLNGSGTLVLRGAFLGGASVGSLEGTGNLYSGGGVFTVQNAVDGTFSGALQTGEDAGVLSVLNGYGNFTMARVQSTADWDVQNAGSLIINQSGAQDNALMTLNRLALLDGSDTLVIFNTDAEVEVFSLGSLLVQDGALLRMQSIGTLPVETDTLVLGNVGAAELGSQGQTPVTLGSGVAFQGVETAWLSVENGMLVLHLQRSTHNQYAARAYTANAQTGAGLLWQIPAAVLRDAPDLSALTNELDALLSQGKDAGLDTVLAAAAGAGAAVLGAAVMGDMERQLRAIRNRTTSMGLPSGIEYEDLPVFNAWVNAEGDWHKRKAEGTSAGYTLSGWGVTVGMDMDFSTAVTAGMAFTGMYGDLSTASPDAASGDVDSYYLSLLGRYIHHRWTHTLAGAFGWSDMTLKRHVVSGGFGYHTRGQTDAVSLGLLYEAGYVIPLDEDNQACLQPVANISWGYARVGAYTEQGSDAALHVGSQDMNRLSFGLGARGQTYALENIMNRSSLLEARLLLKLDAGNRRSSADVSLKALRSRSGRVHSASAGRVGLEMGAGISIPLGVDAGWLFMDAGYEFREDEGNWNGTLGYRLTF